MENRGFNHKKSFNHKQYSHEMTLSSSVWQLKETLDATPDFKYLKKGSSVFVYKIGYYY